VRTRFTLKPFVGYTRFVDRGTDRAVPASPPSFFNSQQQFFGGVRAEVVYDNSITTDMNLIEGTRGKLRFTHFEGLGNKNASFSQVTIDVRHYQKIYKEIVFAVRGFGGTFFGNSAQNFALGGIDNWFLNRINYDGVNNPLASEAARFNQTLLFTEFITNLRGFNYASLYGSSVMVANAELRLPLVRALSSGPITSNFFRNLQLTAFYDIGTSWSGDLPFNSEGTVRTRIVKRDPFSVELKEFINPWLYSYGFGFRSMMLGYYLKFDLAWPVENYVVQQPRVFISLGFDF
jgi:outer membrane protein assembly factor BamA